MFDFSQWLSLSKRMQRTTAASVWLMTHDSASVTSVSAAKGTWACQQITSNTNPKIIKYDLSKTKPKVLGTWNRHGGSMSGQCSVPKADPPSLESCPNYSSSRIFGFCGDRCGPDDSLSSTGLSSVDQGFVRQVQDGVQPKALRVANASRLTR